MGCARTHKVHAQHDSELDFFQTARRFCDFLQAGSELCLFVELLLMRANELNCSHLDI